VAAAGLRPKTAIPFAGIQVIVHSIVKFSETVHRCRAVVHGILPPRRVVRARLTRRPCVRILQRSMKRSYTRFHSGCGLQIVPICESPEPIVSSTSSIGGFSPRQQCLGLFSARSHAEVATTADV